MQKARPQVRTGHTSLKNIIDVDNVQSSALVTRTILSCTISHLFKQRGIYPLDAFTWRNLREGVDTCILRSSDEDESVVDVDSIEYGIRKVLESLHTFFAGIMTGKVTTLTFQLHDESQPQKVEEEWRFEVKYRQTVNASAGFGTQGEPPQSGALFVTPGEPLMPRDDVIDILLETFRKLDSRIARLKPFDWQGTDRDIRLGMVVRMRSDKDEQMEDKLEGFVEVTTRSEAGQVQDAQRLKFSTFQLPFHEITLKCKTNRCLR
ncbi:hypothetical protein BV898_10973 [Hypsibius exemplaris]|uniref:HORMA domain-containing protein n=1 Tax=Hypsibius exemplaris TaxID=2072580 RepID=A0A1W0WHY9_HYPEX|nr:hypothetical protein BV898_10973 [Hypsibius exemplaris]